MFVSFVIVPLVSVTLMRSHVDSVSHRFILRFSKRVFAFAIANVGLVCECLIRCVFSRFASSFSFNRCAAVVSILQFLCCVIRLRSLVESAFWPFREEERQNTIIFQG